MEVSFANSQTSWDEWLKKNSDLNIFSQSWSWGEILSAEGKKIMRLMVIENDKILAQAQVVYNKLPFGWQYVFCGKGPICGKREEGRGKEILENITEYLKKSHSVIFLRFETPSSFPLPSSHIKKSIDVNPRATLVLDLEKTDDDLLSEMHSKTRYNVHLAERKGLLVKAEKDFKNFLYLSKKTAQRDGFRLHESVHYENIINSDLSFQLSVLINNQVIAANLFIGFGNTFTYLYGSSDYTKRDLMAPYLLQWEGIKLAKKLGYKYYDFFGITPKEKNCISNKKHQYAGITRFKLGFGGKVKEDPGTFDVLLDKKKYFVYNLLRKVNRLF